LVAQTIFIVAASERSDSMWIPLVVEERIPAEIEETLQFAWGNSSLLGSCPWTGPQSNLSQCGLVGDCRRIPPPVVCFANVAADVLAFISVVPYPPSLSLYLPHPYLHLFFYLHPHFAISFSISRFLSHVGYGSHDTLALYASPLACM